uniref:Uncharacterized protein n=1 Tax=Anguilla anguilla TaxID=7936 RepID=A0A0E9TNJ7_ANGAN
MTSHWSKKLSDYDITLECLSDELAK